MRTTLSESGDGRPAAAPSAAAAAAARWDEYRLVVATLRKAKR